MALAGEPEKLAESIPAGGFGTGPDEFENPCRLNHGRKSSAGDHEFAVFIAALNSPGLDALEGV
jgi:hypothetical protein